MTAGMVEALISDAGTPSGGMPDMRVLPHLMSTQEIDEFFPIVRLDEGENQWAHELEQGITRPSEELSDPGPRGRLDFVPAMPGAGAFVIDDEKIIEGSDTFLAQGVGDTAQGVGVAQGVGDRSAQGDDDHNDAVFSVTYSEDSEITEASHTSTTNTTASGSHSDESLSVHSRVDIRPRRARR